MRKKDRPSGSRGFTLVEMLIVVALVGIVASMALPSFRHSMLKAKESVLAEDLWTLRDLIDQFYADKGRYPADLEELANTGYIRRVPIDPITGLDDWEVTYDSLAPEDELEGLEDADSGITDVHSSSRGVALDGSYYTDW